MSARPHPTAGAPSAGSARASGRVHLVRHAEVHNPGGIVYGTLPGFALSERGRAQAGAAAQYLASLLSGPVPIIVSPLERARETAAILRQHLGPGPAGEESLSVDPDLTEAGAFLEGLPRKFAPGHYLRRLADREARSRMESPRRILERMLRAVLAATTSRPGQDVLIVSHQFPIRMATVGLEHELGEIRGAAASLLPRLPRWAPWLFIRGRCSPASVTTVVLSAEGPRFSYWEPPER